MMKPTNELTRDILLSCHNVHGKNARIHESTEFLAKERVVVFRSNCIRLRFLKFLPPKVTEQEHRLEIPAYITTEDQLWDYVKETKPFWLHHSNR